MTIKHEDMVRGLAKNGEDIIADLTPESVHLLHMAVGVCGEVGELVAAAMARDDENVREELGDIEFYYTGLCQGLMQEPYYRMIAKQDIADPGLVLTNLVVDSAEVLDQVKKIAVYADSRVEVAQNLWNAMNRFRRTLDEFYSMSPFTQQQAKTANIDKLGERYQNFQYSNEQAKQRKDKQNGE